MCPADGTPGATGADTAASGHSMRAEGRKVRKVYGSGLAVLFLSLICTAPVAPSHVPCLTTLLVPAQRVTPLGFSLFGATAGCPCAIHLTHETRTRA
jgi:hypothetical protein